MFKYSFNDIKCIPTIYALSVRWATKPRWVPIAKTKKFRVYVKPNIPIEEKEEIKRLYNNYRTYMKTVMYVIINFFFIVFLLRMY